MTTPMYQAIAQQIEENLLPTLEDGDRLPSTAALAEQFGVNRLTVRQGLDLLIRTGRITSSRGQGTFKKGRAHRYEVAARPTASLSEQMAREGRTVVNHILDHCVDERPPSHVQFDRPSIRIESFRTVDAAPWSLTRTWFNPDLFPDIVDHWSETGSLSAVLQQHYGRRMVRGVRSFAAVAADAQVSEYLGIAIGQPTLRVRGSNEDSETGEIIIYVQHLFPGEGIEFTTRLR